MRKKSLLDFAVAEYLIEVVDILCEHEDLNRSQFFRRAFDAYQPLRSAIDEFEKECCSPRRSSKTFNDKRRNDEGRRWRGLYQSMDMFYRGYYIQAPSSHSLWRSYMVYIPSCSDYDRSARRREVRRYQLHRTNRSMPYTIAC